VPSCSTCCSAAWTGPLETFPGSNHHSQTLPTLPGYVSLSMDRKYSRHTGETKQLILTEMFINTTIIIQ